MANWKIEQLSDGHDRTHFDCGVESLNDWLKFRAGQFERKDLARTFIATQSASQVCLGYYALSTHHVNFPAVPQEALKGLPQIDIPVALLGKLAVDRNQQGQGLGEYLLVDALWRVMSVADKIGVRAVEVDAIDETAKRFYLKYGFRELKDDHRHLFLPIHEVRRLKLPPL